MNSSGYYSPSKPMYTTPKNQTNNKISVWDAMTIHDTQKYQDEV